MGGPVNSNGAHEYGGMGDELWIQAGGQVDAFVRSVGTAHSLHGGSRGSGATGRTAFEVDDDQGTVVDGIRVFAGPRWDPFILDAPAALRTIATGDLAFTDPGSIYLDGKNVLSLVVEVDCSRMLPGAVLIGSSPRR